MKRQWTLPTIMREEPTQAFPHGRIRHDSEAVAAILLETQGMLSRQGGTLAIGTIREEVEPGRVETVALQVVYDTYVPMERKAEQPPQQPAETPPAPQPAPDPEPEPEPEPADPERTSREERVTAGQI